MAFVEKMNQRMIGMFVEWSGRSRDEVARRMEDETQFTAAGLLEFGLIDKIEA
jgi:ATP-dependent protease ClpP protease subunit